MNSALFIAITGLSLVFVGMAMLYMAIRFLSCLIPPEESSKGEPK